MGDPGQNPCSGTARCDGLCDQWVACLMIRATCSSRQAEPRRVRSDWRFSAAAIPRNMCPLWRRWPISVSTCSPGSGSACFPSGLRRNPNRIFPTRSPLVRLCLSASRVRGQQLFACIYDLGLNRCCRFKRSPVPMPALWGSRPPATPVIRSGLAWRPQPPSRAPASGPS